MPKLLPCWTHSDRTAITINLTNNPRSNELEVLNKQKFKGKIRIEVGSRGGVRCHISL